MEALNNSPVVQVRHDLLDCEVSICSVEVPALFTENFDYRDVAGDFVHGILTSDLLGKRIYCHLIGDEYAARVKNTFLYDSISRDIITRWTFPLVPDSNIHEDDAYTHARGDIYIGRGVKLARSCLLDRKVIVGAGSEIGENAKISNSIIGRNCRVGADSVIDNSYIWNSVVIGRNCSIHQSIISDDVELFDSVHLQRGSIISSNVMHPRTFFYP